MTRKYVSNYGRYGFWNFALDAFMTIITSGLWLIWVIIREARKN